jgi:hypothetical protein
VEPKQSNLFGELEEIPDLGPEDRVAYILEHEPETRADDRLLMLHYWVTFDGLGQVLSKTALGKFSRWWGKATHPETIRRQRARFQRLSSGGGHLLPDRKTAEYRRKQARRGPPRR